MDRTLRAAAVLALVGIVVCGPFSGASPAWAAAEHKPAPPANATAAKPAVATLLVVRARADKAIPAALLVPVAHAPADLVAPSYTTWRIDPSYEALPGEKFIARGQVTAAIEGFQRGIAISPPNSTSSASIHSALIPLSVPLPPKRLAEKRSVVLASLAPLPPTRLVELMPAAPQALAMAPVAPPPNDVVPLRDADAAADPDANELQVDAARPIDDGPEPVATRATADRAPPQIEALISRHADRFDVPESLVRRVAWRESKFDPRRRNGPYWGLMQIRVDTARGLGFRGAPSDLLDAHTNMTYAVAYLANAYRVAGRDEKRAVSLYAKGYYYEAKRKRMLDKLIRTAAAEK